MLKYNAYIETIPMRVRIWNIQATIDPKFSNSNIVLVTTMEWEKREKKCIRKNNRETNEQKEKIIIDLPDLFPERRGKR